MKRVALLVALCAVTMPLSCKRDVDMILPDAGATPTTSAITSAAATAAPRPSGPDDTVEPLATLSSGRGATPIAPNGPAVRPQGDSGAAAASAATAIGVPPTGATAGTGMPPLPTGMPTVPPTVATTLPPPTGMPTTPPPVGGEPQECAAARLMRQLGRTNEAETLRVKCVEKGGKDPFS